MILFRFFKFHGISRPGVAAPDHILAKIFKTGQNHVFPIRAFKSPEKAGFLDIWVGGVSGTGWCPKMLKSAQKCILTYSQKEAILARGAKST